MKENIIRWVGGKSDLAESIIQKMAPHTKYVEVFMGGGNVFLQKPLAQMNIVNDLNGNLINMYKTINDDTQKELLKQLLSNINYSRDLFNYFLASYNNPEEWEKLPAVVKALRFIYINRASFSALGKYYARKDDGSPVLNLETIIQDMYMKFKMGKTVFENLPFQSLLKRNGNNLAFDSPDVKTFLYLDPPYWVTTTKQGEEYYDVTMKAEEHTELRDLLIEHKYAKWLLSYDNHEEIRKLYQLIPTNKDQTEFTSIYPTISAILTSPMHQSMMSATRESGNQTYKQELLIANYELKTVNTLFE